MNFNLDKKQIKLKHRILCERIYRKPKVYIKLNVPININYRKKNRLGRGEQIS